MQPLSKQEPIGLLVAVARRRIKQAVGARVRPLRMTPQQFWVLLAVLESEGPSLGELAERLRIDQPTASRVVAALVRRRLVRVETSRLDRRRSRLLATAAGESRRAAIEALAAEIRVGLVADLADEEQAALRTGLRKIIANMERLERSRAPVRRPIRGAP
jgi:DNA-binding MarR family transcriptional regulator